MRIHFVARIKGNPVSIRNSTRYCETLYFPAGEVNVEKHTHTTVSIQSTKREGRFSGLVRKPAGQFRDK